MPDKPHRVLICWVGRTDLRAASGAAGVGLGPIAQAVAAREFDEIHLLCDYPAEQSRPFNQWLEARTKARLVHHLARLTSPVNFGEIYKAAVSVLAGVLSEHGKNADLTFHLSPGTPAMAAVWIIIAKTRHPAELIESSPEAGVNTASVPFDISAEFIPDLLRRPDEKLQELARGLPDEAPEFDQIIHRSPVMKSVIAYARRVAVRSIPVLIEGESGTGKELLARAIHMASPRATKAFVAVNCGAIPSELVESEFFGHKKGAFTGAATDRAGHFERANGGTLFLDEIGELPVPVQVKLLRVLQEGEVTRVGESETRKVNVRVLAATNRKLLEEVGRGSFREDLFYRLAVAVLRLPPLREREGDISLLVEALLKQVNEKARDEPGFREKKLSAGAKNLLLRQPWQGNVRELLNTLQRAAVWSDEETISTEAAREAILEGPASKVGRDGILDRSINQGLDLQEIIAEVARHYLRRALTDSGDNRSRAAKLLGFRSYQTLDGWLKRYDVKH